MISDELDEDADNLDDELVIGAVVGHDPPNQGSGDENATPASDWPVLRAKDVGLNLDHDTLAWFKANHSDWRAEIDFVLQAWVRCRMQDRPQNLPATYDRSQTHR